MQNRIKQIMAKAFELPVEQITEQSSQDNIGNWDSLHHIKLIVFLEREFDVSIPDDEVGNMLNYRLIERVINNCNEPAR